VALAALLVAGCGGGSKSAGGGGGAVSVPASVQCDKPGTCEPPDALVQAAKKEGQVVMYSALGSATMNQFSDAMQKKYGVKIVFSEIKQADATQRVRQEFEAKNFQADIVPLGDPDTFHQWLADGMLATVSQGEIPNTKALNADTFKENSYIMWGGPAYTLAWNKSKLPDGKPPQSYCDLTDPKWKGNFALTFQPGSTTFVHYHLMQELCGNDVFTKFKQNGVKLYPATAVANPALAAGEYAVLLSGIPYQLDPLIQKGAPIEYRLQEEGITISTRWTAIIKGAPHPNAARLFVNFLLSQEGQEIAFGKNFGVSILPKDLVPDAIIPPGKAVYATVPEAGKWEPDIAQQLGQQQ
jgi:iron(III) transport system substrate-binding protein